MIITLIVAADLDDCIGKNNEIPWSVPSDLARFKELTKGHVCIMGRKTHESILERLGKPLPGRKSIVVSRTETGAFVDGRFVDSLDSALEAVRETVSDPDTAEVFVIGGAQVYQEALPHVDKILLTRVQTRVNGDTFMPQNWLGGFFQTEASTNRLWGPRDEIVTSYTTYER